MTAAEQGLAAQAAGLLLVAAAVGSVVFWWVRKRRRTPEERVFEMEFDIGEGEETENPLAVDDDDDDEHFDDELVNPNKEVIEGFILVGSWQTMVRVNVQSVRIVIGFGQVCQPTPSCVVRCKQLISTVSVTWLLHCFVGRWATWTGAARRVPAGPALAAPGAEGHLCL
jgi:hypothetical protein